LIALESCSNPQDLEALESAMKNVGAFGFVVSGIISGLLGLFGPLHPLHLAMDPNS